MEEACELRTQLSRLQEEMSGLQRQMMMASPVTPQSLFCTQTEVAEGDVAKVVSRWTGVDGWVWNKVLML